MSWFTSSSATLLGRCLAQTAVHVHVWPFFSIRSKRQTNFSTRDQASWCRDRPRRPRPNRPPRPTQTPLQTQSHPSIRPSASHTQLGRDPEQVSLQQNFGSKPPRAHTAHRELHIGMFSHVRPQNDLTYYHKSRFRLARVHHVQCGLSDECLFEYFLSARGGFEFQHILASIHYLRYRATHTYTCRGAPSRTRSKSPYTHQ